VDELDGFVVEGNHAVYRPVGCVSFDEAVNRVRAAISCARSKEVRNLLVNTTAWTGFDSPDTFQRFLAASEWAEAARFDVRLAIVARAELIDPERFGVIVARNRGLVNNIFTSEVEARDWLCGAHDH
jgi:hypothetical protein